MLIHALKKNIFLSCGLLLIAFITLFVTKCHHQPTETKTHVEIVQVESSPVHKTLFFTGSVQPIREKALSTPIDGVIESMPYQYGQNVPANQEVFILHSVELQKQYNEALTEYLKAKDNYTISEAKFSGTEDLWKDGLLAKNTYLSEKSSLNTAHISLMQAHRRLLDLLKGIGEQPDAYLKQLSFANFDKIKHELETRHDRVILTSSYNGILLYPPSTSDEKLNHVTVGSSAKAGQVLALLGDLSGIRLEIDIPEVDVENIHAGMSAKIGGVAFAKEVLQGKLVSINAQASSHAGGTLPSFTAVVIVDHLTKKQQQLIKVGMSASVELSIDEQNRLLIPIRALRLQHGRTVVHIRDKNGKIHEQQVVTGPAQASQVVIESGLNAGEEVLIETNTSQE